MENLFCTPELIELISKRLARNPNNDIESVKSFVISRVNSEIENQISMRTASEIKFRLNCYNDKAVGKEALREALNDLSLNINIEEIYNQNASLFMNAVESQDYLSILRLYNRKSLARQISSHLGLAHGELAELVIRLANSADGAIVRRCLKPYFGDFAEKMA